MSAYGGTKHDVTDVIYWSDRKIESAAMRTIAPTP